MNKKPGAVKFASITLLVMGILLGLVVTFLTLVSGSSSNWLIAILPCIILTFLFIVAGIGMLFGKRWAWWIAQFVCLLFSFAFIRFIILLTDKLPEVARGIPVILLIPTISYLLFRKDSMQYFKFDESKRIKTIITAIIIPAVLIFVTIIRDIILKYLI